MAAFSTAAVIAADQPAMVSAAEQVSVESLVREHGRMVFRIGYSVLQDHHEAEDVAQEVFLRLCRQRDSLAKILEPKAWLAQVAWRVAVDRVRSRPKVHMDEEAVERAIGELRSNDAPADEALGSSEMLQAVNGLIDRLPAKEREALLLSALDELSMAEIAKALKTSEASVRGRIFRARQQLRQKLGAMLDRTSR